MTPLLILAGALAGLCLTLTLAICKAASLADSRIAELQNQ